MFKVIILLIVVLAVFTGFGLLIPDTLSTGIDNAIIYFLTALWNLNGLFDVAVLFDCLRLLTNFYLGVSIFWIFHWVLNVVKG